MDRLKSVYRRAVVWDNHTCMPMRENDVSFLPQLGRHRAAGTTVVSLNVCSDTDVAGQPFEYLRLFREWIAARPDEYALVTTVDDILRAKDEGKLAVVFDVEGGLSIQDDPERVAQLYALGVRWMLLAYNRNNRLAGGCLDEDEGISAQGYKVLDVMKRVGMVLCCSHIGARSAIESIDYMQQPVIFSHSNPSAVYYHPRNISDELIRACARSGGVVNVNGIGIFLGKNDHRTETYVRHVQYVADLVGPEYVGLGLDYEYDSSEIELLMEKPHIWPKELGFGHGMHFIEPERIPEIAEALLATGWTDNQLDGFLGGNNLRVARQVWK